MSGPVGPAAVVAKPDAEACIDALRAEGVYDETRSVAEHDSRTVALPVTAAPADERVRDVIETRLPRRERGLDALLRERGWTAAERRAAPRSWAVIGSVVLVAPGDAPRPREVGEALLDLHGEADTVLARGGIAGVHREPDVTVLAGTGDTETVHVEHGTEYALDLSEVMFSPGNKAERARMGEVVAPGERVFDMFAGVGYFTLPIARTGARVVAAERNPVAHGYLVENARRNGVAERVDARNADCRDVRVSADRVVMGYYEAHGYLDAALDALAPGGRLHLHEATPETLVPDRPVGRLETAAADHGRAVEIEGVRRVKSHSEGVAHVVVDARVD